MTFPIFHAFCISNQPISSSNKAVILRVSELFHRSFFLHIQPAVFQPPKKAVILSEALRGSIGHRKLYARSRRACPEHSRGDPGDARWQMLLRAFRPRTKTEDKKVTNSERSIACGPSVCACPSIWPDAFGGHLIRAKARIASRYAKPLSPWHL